MEAFTDGVVAIIITIMVLELRPPSSDTAAGLLAAAPLFLAYALSFVNVGVFWNNHHHMLHVTERIDGRVLWANLFLLFWISLIPFVIRWMGDAHFASLPTAAYGAVLAMCGVGYAALERTIIACNERNAALATAVGDDIKAWISLGIYIVAMPLAFVSPWISIALYVASALMWFAPDRRIEAVVEAAGD